ncbi:hypothetical protein D3C74_51560 [compost metagenome]
MNKIYDHPLYNEEMKQSFVKDMDNSKEIMRIFKRVAPLEETLGMDLYDFKLEHIEQFLKLLQSKKVNPVKQAAGIVELYIKWAIVQGERQDTSNPFDEIQSVDFYRAFVDTRVQTIFSEEELNDMVDGAINFQDKIVVQALFEGIYGREYSELLHLQIQDVRADTLTVLLHEDDKGIRRQRTIPISQQLYDIIRIANKEKEYKKNNGIVSPSIKKDYNELVTNSYVVRPARNVRTRDANAPAHPALINRRIATLAEYYGRKGLTPTNIRNSGMLKMARDLYEEKGQLGDVEYKLICDHYNTGITAAGYNLNRFKIDFLNHDTLNQIYSLNLRG